MSRSLIVPIALLSLAGCSLVNPFVINRKMRDDGAIRAVRAGSTKPERDAAAEFQTASAYAAKVKQKYREALGDQAKLQSWLGIGLIPLSAAAIGLGVAGGNAPSVLALGLTGGAGFGTSMWLLNKPRQLGYVAGIKAVTCAEEAVTPLALNQTEIASLDKNLATLDAAIRPVQNEIATVAALVDGLSGQLADAYGQADTGHYGDLVKDARNEITAAKSIITSAENAYSGGTEVKRLAASAGRRLTIAIDKIVDAVDGIIVETQRDPQALSTIISGLGATYKTLTSVPESIKAPTAPAKASGLAPQADITIAPDVNDKLKKSYEELVAAVKKLRERSADLSSAIRPVASIVNAVTKDVPVKALESCGVKAGDVVTGLSIDPAGPFEVEKAGSVGFVVKGGAGLYAAKVTGPGSGVTVMQDAPFGSSFTVTATKDAQSGTYQVMIVDSAGQAAKPIQVSVKDAAVKNTPQTDGGATTDPNKMLAANAAAFIGKVKHQLIAVPGSGVTLKIGDPKFDQGKITVPADVDSVRQPKLEAFTQDAVVAALQKVGLNSIKSDQIVVDFASLKKSAVKKAAAR